MAEYIVRVEEGSKADLFRKRMGSEPATIYGCAVVGEIVRCRDCRHYREATFEYSAFGRLPSYEDTERWCHQTDSPVTPDGFCELGERRGK